MTRWAIWIDIEGFSRLYRHEARALATFGCLMEGVYRIGSRAFPKSPDCLFAHHIGDGFVLVSDFGSTTLDRPVCIAIALLRHVASTDWFCKAAIGEGDFADIRGCYPETLREAGSDGCNHIPMGDGLLTTLPVMGTALIRAHEISRKASGALLLVAKSEHDRLPPCNVSEIDSGGVLSIDWIHSEPAGLSDLQERASLSRPGVAEIERSLTSYCNSEGASAKWKSNTRGLLSLPDD
jgi:hypothetical protein